MKTLVILHLLLVNINLSAQTNKDSIVKATLPKISYLFHNIRDFTSRGNEAYFSAQSTLGDRSVIIRVRKTNNHWGTPSIASFSGQHHDLEPFLSSDRLKLFFASNRPKATTNLSNDYDIWYVKRDRITAEWSKPINMGKAINSDNNEFYPSLANNNNLYFTANKEDSKGKDDIYLSIFKDGQYQASHSLGDGINTEGAEYNAYISDDETYLIFGAYKRADSFGSGDLYISYRDGKNNWLKAENLGPTINSKYMDYCPFVDNDILYFTSKRNEMNTDIFTEIEDLAKAFNGTKNGMSRIYQANFNR